MKAETGIRTPKTCRWLVSVGVGALLGAVEAARACVGCREPGSLTMARENPTVMAGIAFSWSVLFMLLVVFFIALAMSFYIWQTCRRVGREPSGDQ